VPTTPHVLYVAWGFPPCRGAGAYRAVATANAFAEDGWRVTVLTADRESWDRYTGSDPTLEASVDPRVELLRVPVEWPALDYDLRRWCRARARNPQRWAKLRRRLDQVRFPEPGYGPWGSRTTEAALALHRRDPVDLVVGSANPNVDFLPGWALHDKHGVPFVMDYRDAWVLDVFSGDQLHTDGSRQAGWERKLVAAAREVWFVNEPIRAWHQQRYPASADRMHVVANGFNPELAPQVSAPSHGGDRPVRFGYLGTVSPKVPLGDFLAGWELGRAQSPLLATATATIHGYLGFYATPRGDMLAAIEAAAARSDGSVRYGGPVGKTDIHSVYEHLDVLLLMLGTGRYVTSSKVYEYVATGLPVVSVHDPGNAASDVLRNYPLWFPAASLSAEDVAAALAAAAEAVVSSGTTEHEKALAFAQQFRRDLQLTPRVAALRAGLRP
jgi:glycosyltransferase involved in cell wall biosynthesis